MNGARRRIPHDVAWKARMLVHNRNNKQSMIDFPGLDFDEIMRVRIFLLSICS